MNEDFAYARNTESGCKSVDKTLVCDHSNESYCAVLSCIACGHSFEQYDFFASADETLVWDHLNECFYFVQGGLVCVVSRCLLVQLQLLHP